MQNPLPGLGQRREYKAGEFAEWMRNYRKTSGWTLDELSERLQPACVALGLEGGISRQAIHTWEAGKVRPGVEYLMALSIFSGVSVHYLLHLVYATPLPDSTQEEVTAPEMSAIISLLKGHDAGTLRNLREAVEAMLKLLQGGRPGDGGNGGDGV